MCAAVRLPRRPLSTYRVIWCTPGDLEVNHLVVARDDNQARRISVEELREIVGNTFAGWRIKRIL